MVGVCGTILIVGSVKDDCDVVSGGFIGEISAA